MTLFACADCGKQFPEDDLAWQNGDDGYCPECMVKFNKMLADVAELMQHPPVPNPEPEVDDYNYDWRGPELPFCDECGARLFDRTGCYHTGCKREYLHCTNSSCGASPHVGEDWI